MDLHDFYTGRTFDAHRFFGAHFEGDFVTFRTYAPGAQAVELIGEFNGWQGMPMAREGQGGVFSCRIQGAKPGMVIYVQYKTVYVDPTTEAKAKQQS